jgi:hypothetical protein
VWFSNGSFQTDSSDLHQMLRSELRMWLRILRLVLGRLRQQRSCSCAAMQPQRQPRKLLRQHSTIRRNSQRATQGCGAAVFGRIARRRRRQGALLVLWDAHVLHFSHCIFADVRCEMLSLQILQISGLHDAAYTHLPHANAAASIRSRVKMTIVLSKQ